MDTSPSSPCLHLRILTRLLEVSDDPQVIAVAAHDVGEYVRHYPRGKRYGFLVAAAVPHSHSDLTHTGA